MTADPEAAGDALTGAIVGRTIDGAAGGATQTTDVTDSNCLNCGAPLRGAFCSNCGQTARPHRSLASIGHEILHGVFHFEGKIFRTLPELCLHPGRLTRRYIDGERVKFVSPMALFLFTVFLMFAVFSATGLLDGEGLDPNQIPIASDWQAGNAAAIAETNEKIEQLRTRLEDPALDAEQRAQIAKDMTDLEAAKAVMQALAKGDWKALAEIDERNKANAPAAPPPSSQTPEPPPRTEFQWPTPGGKLDLAIKHAWDNPRLLMYKVKTNAYKFSWALIPMSVPFLWLMFCWRRDVHVYDHAVFTTYSISFMMLFFILLSVAMTTDVGKAIGGLALLIVPPLHMYKQLRGTYSLSRFGALVRLVMLLIVTFIVLLIFTVVLFVIGALD